jgi:iron-sulfur cluster assembly protein
MISITDRAASQARKLMVENDLSPEGAPGLRLGVKAGGCSGLNYVLDIVESPEENDRSFQLEGVNLYIDPKSYLYLNGTEIDFEETKMGGGFKFNNPNAKRSCGCGTSFTV